jgi:hypothetical protein
MKRASTFALASFALAVAGATAGCGSCNGGGGEARDAAAGAFDAAETANAADGSLGFAHETVGDAGAEGLVSLLAWTDSRVAVSSTVDNPRDFPEHLIDGKMDTAWNGKTGDLLGGFIAFRVPKEARVDRVRIACGFDRKAKDGRDLFTANHRIARLRVWRDGTALKEVTLDTSRRDLQSIDIDGPGGDYRLSVLETLPGTEPSWKELVVSELQVLGDPRGARLPGPHTPRVRVGSLDAAEWDGAAPSGKAAVETGPRSSIDAYCTWFVKKHDAAVRATWTDPSHPCQDDKARATCNAKTANDLSATGAFKGVFSIWSESADDIDDDYALVANDGSFTIVGGTVHGRCELGDPGTTGFSVVNVETRTLGPDGGGGGGAVAMIVTESISNEPMYSDPDTGEPAMWVRAMASRDIVMCTAAPSGPPSCAKLVTVGMFVGNVGMGAAPPFEKWPNKKTYALSPDGKLIVK